MYTCSRRLPIPGQKNYSSAEWPRLSADAFIRPPQTGIATGPAYSYPSEQRPQGSTKGVFIRLEREASHPITGGPPTTWSI
jgi:hypothetical protein